MFEHLDAYAGDPILSLNEDFQKDPRPHKINLSIGIYFDDAGRIPVERDTLYNVVWSADPGRAPVGRPAPVHA